MTKLSESLERVGGLSTPSKMPGYGWSIPAWECDIGGKLQQTSGSVCENCYAMKGRYTFGAVRNALENRLALCKKDNHEWRDAFIYYLTNAPKFRAKADYYYPFRWFDSGDLQGEQMLDDICFIATHTPHIKHWLPTKEYMVANLYMKNNWIPPNLTIRISHPMVNKNFKRGDWMNHSGVFDKEHLPEARGAICPSSKQNNECRDCRMCWDGSIEVINYINH